MFVSISEYEAARKSALLNEPCYQLKSTPHIVNSIDGLSYVSTEYSVRYDICGFHVKCTETSFHHLLAALRELNKVGTASLIAFTPMRKGATPQFCLRLMGASAYEKAVAKMNEVLDKLPDTQAQSVSGLYTGDDVFQKAIKSTKTPTASIAFGKVLSDGSNGLVQLTSVARLRKIGDDRAIWKWKICTVVNMAGLQTLMKIYANLHQLPCGFDSVAIVFTYVNKALLAEIVVHVVTVKPAIVNIHHEYEAKLLKAISEAI